MNPFGFTHPLKNALCLLLTLGLLVFPGCEKTAAPNKTTVPNVVGMAHAAASTAITDAGLTVGAVTEEFSATAPAAQVMRQDPAAASLVSADTAVALVVSKGPQSVTVAVPNVVGLTQASASAAITGAGLKVGAAAQEFSATVPAGQVISQNPAMATQVSLGTAIGLVVSKGPQPVSVPNVVGQTQAVAATTLTGAGLTVGTVTEAFRATVPAGQVISQNPLATAQVSPGTAVALLVSKGPTPVNVPNVAGLTQAAASAAITGANLTIGTVTQAYSSTVISGSVISQSPAAGASAAPGTAVALVVSKGPQTVSVPNVVGLTQAVAATTITGAGLTIGTVTEAFSATVPAGIIISQNPTVATQVNLGTAVALVTSRGQPAGVPNVVGLTQAVAATIITGAGLTVGAVTEEYSAVPAGQVISQDPEAAAQVGAGTAVALVVSKGPQYSLTVNVTGQGWVTLDPSGGKYNAGTVVTVNVLPADGWLFGHWAVDLAGEDAPAQITVTKNANIEAVFTEVLRGNTRFTQPAGIETFELPDGTKVDAAAHELVVGLKSDITPVQLNALLGQLTANGCKTIGFSTASKMLQVRVNDTAKSLATVIEALKALTNVTFTGPNQVIESFSIRADGEAAPGDNLAGLMHAKDLPEVRVPYSLTVPEPKTDVVWHPSSFSGDYWIHLVKAPDAWAVSTGSADVRIGIVDNGFAGSDTVIASDRLTRVFCDGTAGSFDLGFPHGRWVTAFAAGNGADATLNAVGMAWLNPVTTVSLQKPKATTSPVMTNMVAALDRAISEGARVVNISAGYGLGRDSAGTEAAFETVDTNFREAVTGCVENARRNDVLMCFAAGNDGMGTDTNHWPAVDRDCNGVMGDPADTEATTTSTGFPNFVPAVSVRDDDELLPAGSSASPNGWLTNAVIVGACAAQASVPAGPTIVQDLTRHGTELFYQFAPRDDATNSPPGKIAQFSHLGNVVNLMAPGFMVGYGPGEIGDGTSHAAAIVTGAAALIAGTNTDLAACEVRRILMDSASARSYAGRSVKVGKGLVDAGKASEMAKSSLDVPVYRAPAFVDLAATLAKDATASFSLPVTLPASTVKSIDVVICTDVTGSYGDDIDTLKVQAHAIVEALTGTGADVQFGLASFADFPLGDYGSLSSDDQAYYLDQPVTSQLPDVYAAIDGLTIHDGADTSESQYEALYQLATGAGHDLNGDGNYDPNDGDIIPAGVGWRPGALRVVIFSTDARFHDSDTEIGYPGYGRTVTLAALQDAHIMVLGLNSGDAGAELQAVADATGGSIYALTAGSANIVDAIKTALAAALSRVTVSLEALNDAEGFIQSPESLVFTDVEPGQTVTFTINLKGVLNQSTTDLTYQIRAWVLVNKSGLIMRVPITVTVPQG